MKIKAQTILYLIALFVHSQANSQPNVGWLMIYEHQQKEFLSDVYRVEDRGYIACGATADTFYGLNDLTSEMWIVRIDTDGEILWEQLFGEGNVNDRLYSVIDADNGDFVSSGHSGGTVAAVRLSEEGEIVWFRTYETGKSWAIIELKNGNFVITGTSGRNAFLLCIDGDGEQLWREYYQGDGIYSLHTLRETEGGVICGGFCASQRWYVSVGNKSEC